MAPATQIILSGMLTFGVPLLIAARELVVVNRKPQSDRRMTRCRPSHRGRFLPWISTPARCRPA